MARTLGAPCNAKQVQCGINGIILCKGRCDWLACSAIPREVPRWAGSLLGECPFCAERYRVNSTWRWHGLLPTLATRHGGQWQVVAHFLKPIVLFGDGRCPFSLEPHPERGLRLACFFSMSVDLVWALRKESCHDAGRALMTTITPAPSHRRRKTDKERREEEKKRKEESLRSAPGRTLLSSSLGNLVAPPSPSPVQRCEPNGHCRYE